MQWGPAHHALRSAVVPRADEPPPEPKQLVLFVPRGHIEFPATTTLLDAQLRDAAPSRLSWMTLLARVFRIDSSVCARFAPMPSLSEAQPQLTPGCWPAAQRPRSPAARTTPPPLLFPISFRLNADDPLTVFGVPLFYVVLIGMLVFFGIDFWLSQRSATQ